MAHFLKNQNIPLFLLSLIPLGYVLDGVFPPIFETTMFLYFILYIVSVYQLTVGNRKFRLSKIDIILYMWALFLLFGVLYTPFQYGGILKFLKFIVVSLGIVFFCRVHFKVVADFTVFYKYLFYNSVLLCYMVLFDFIFSGMDSTRYMAFGTVIPIPLSLIGGMTVLLAVLFYIFKQIDTLRLILSLFPSFMMITITASKGPVIALAVGLIVISPLIVNARYLKLLFLSVISSPLLLQIDIFSESFANLQKRFLNTGDDMSTLGRFDLYNQALNYFYESPLLGRGTDSMYPNYPHNIFLEILSDHGIVLLSIILLLIILLAKSLVDEILKKGTELEPLFIYTMFFSSLTSLMFSFSYVDHKYFFLAIGLFLSWRLVLSNNESLEILQR